MFPPLVRWRKDEIPHAVADVAQSRLSLGDGVGGRMRDPGSGRRTSRRPRPSARGRAGQSSSPTPPCGEHTVATHALPSAGADSRSLRPEQAAGLFKALFYMRENSPLDIAPRARGMVVGALHAVALQDNRDIVVEADSDQPPRWVTVTVNDERCTLNLDRVDAPWTLRTTLQDALRFVQGNLRPAPPGVDPAERLFGVEIAATNGMLAAFDGRSALLDVETYKKVRPPLANGRAPADAAGDAAHLQEAPDPHVAGKANVSVETGRLASGYEVAYAHLASFKPGVSGEVARWLANSTQSTSRA